MTNITAKDGTTIYRKVWGPKTKSYTALQRSAHPDEIASLVAHLARPAISYITSAGPLANGG